MTASPYAILILHSLFSLLVPHARFVYPFPEFSYPSSAFINVTTRFSPFSIKHPANQGGLRSQSTNTEFLTMMARKMKDTDSEDIIAS